MSASPEPEPEQPLISLDEYITLCADLYNTLLAKSLPPNSPPPETSTDLLQRYESFRANGPFDTYDPYIPPSLDPLSPLASLLSQLRTTIPSPISNLTPLTPLLYQPIPEYFFPPLYSNELDEADSPFLLLYPQRLPSEAQYASDGGLFVDIYDLRGIWLGAPPGPGNLPSSEKWLPLDYLLRLELSRWESGRYIHDSTAEDGLKVQKWVPVPSTTTTTTTITTITTTPWPNLQVAEAISEWERLLSAIESRIPSSSTPEGTSPGERERIEPLRLEAMEGLHLGKFATQFLTRACRPKGWTFVAPGIGTFSSEASLREVYTAAEPEDASFRRTFTNPEGEENWVTLLLPSVAVAADGVKSTPVQVPADVSRYPDLDDVNSFDKPYGFSKATVGRRAGLYTSWADERNGDLVQLVCPSGRTNAGVFGGPCPWGPDRGPRLAEVLGHWANLVEDGVWAVGEDGVEEDGVEEDAAWFDEHVDLANLSWDHVIE
ncbi:hypothetical protein C8A00DRAFT_12038 [Chaetomidium leptoderma]|uniref:Uncharacterized protein n=1 Tax=Chaetomidium leptoderma TaxID=669021 RepID=A0AAN6VTK3_9PEZI|nr:hypothetical protein C8A00DRAFT_12038 [Chaetomidium leptoderma]